VLLNYVAPEARFKGASKSLTNEIEIWASSCGIKCLALESTATALRFYQSNGWTSTGAAATGLWVTTKNPMHKAIA
jgi:GNAT superfamily N-acetyltransferase